MIADSSSTDFEVESAIGTPTLLINASAKPISSRQFESEAYLLLGRRSFLSE